MAKNPRKRIPIDSRRRGNIGNPTTPQQQKTATKIELSVALQEEKERIQLLMFLIKRAVRQALGIGSKDVGFKFWLDDFEDGYRQTRSIKTEYDPSQIVTGWSKEGRPYIVKVSKEVEVYPREITASGSPMEVGKPKETPKKSGK